ncbi:hypothetical protein [Pseudidiomarina donghaiensis]|uniref:Uncharacterized protein n=1 Tax=Pseudidiomarina donghaiensis TaxID=519452 RepID=A0A432XDH3_9GAMM|nr:hypothetical protein [Pseudidiomarina donghaiensis]RUO46702.1 hypothetical protein CWE24_10680 [Pseudidiomarina donghaiensis]
MTLSNADNIVIEHRSYDPFGKPRHGSLEANLPATLRGLLGGNDPITLRGFTDHEHLDEAQLIHMNGRGV